MAEITFPDFAQPVEDVGAAVTRFTARHSGHAGVDALTEVFERFRSTFQGVVERLRALNAVRNPTFQASLDWAVAMLYSRHATEWDQEVLADRTFDVDYVGFIDLMVRQTGKMEIAVCTTLREILLTRDDEYTAALRSLILDGALTRATLIGGVQSFSMYIVLVTKMFLEATDDRYSLAAVLRRIQFNERDIFDFLKDVQMHLAREVGRPSEQVAVVDELRDQVTALAGTYRGDPDLADILRVLQPLIDNRTPKA
jgi:hypothetical protein